MLKLNSCLSNGIKPGGRNEASMASPGRPSAKNVTGKAAETGSSSGRRSSTPSTDENMHKPNRNKLALHLFHFLSPSPRQRRTNGTRRRRSSRSGKDSSLLGKLSPDLPPAVDFHHGSSPRERTSRQALLEDAWTKLQLDITSNATETNLDSVLNLILHLLDGGETWLPSPCSLTTAAPPEEEGQGAGRHFSCANRGSYLLACFRKWLSYSARRFEAMTHLSSLKSKLTKIYKYIWWDAGHDGY